MILIAQLAASIKPPPGRASPALSSQVRRITSRSAAIAGITVTLYQSPNSGGSSDVPAGMFLGFGPRLRGEKSLS